MIISIVNQKGGVGKTTTAVNLGAALARAGKRTLLVDLDPQGNASSGVGVAEEHKSPGVYEFLRGEADAASVIRDTGIENFHVLPTGPELAGASVELLGEENREYRLRDALAPVSLAYDYVIIDAPPSLGILTMNALVASDRLLIPVQCEYYALEGLGQLLQTIALVQENLHPDLKIIGVVLTLFDRRVKVAHDVVKEVREHFPGHVFGTIVPRNIRLAEAPSFGKNIFDYDPNSFGAAAYRELAVELDREAINQVTQKSEQ